MNAPILRSDSNNIVKVLRKDPDENGLPEIDRCAIRKILSTVEHGDDLKKPFSRRDKTSSVGFRTLCSLKSLS